MQTKGDFFLIFLVSLCESQYIAMNITMKHYLQTALLCLVFLSSVHAQHIALDPTFKPNGLTVGSITQMALQADGKIIIIGNFTQYDGIEAKGIARIHSNGRIDTSFKTGLGFMVGINHLPHTIHIQNNGKILIGGRFNSYNTSYAINIVRLNQDGSTDTSFNATQVSGFNDGKGNVYCIKTQPDGKIIAGGNFAISDKFESWNLVRFNADGTLDKTFSLIGGSHAPAAVKINNGSANVTDLAIQEDGKIILVGNFTKYNLLTVNHLIRLNADGTIDSSFNKGSGANQIIQSVTLQKDGKILLSGWFDSFDGKKRTSMARLHSSGVLDTSFVPDITQCGNFCVMKHKSLPDGRILNSSNWLVLNQNGSKDTTLWQETFFEYGSITDVLDQPDGKILVSGYFGNYQGISTPRILRFEAQAVGLPANKSNYLPFEIWPNPMQNDTEIRIEKPITNATLLLRNVLGENMLTLKQISGTSIRIERRLIPAGIYFLSIESGHSTGTQKLIVVD